MAISPCDKFLLSGTSKGELNQWNIELGSFMQEFDYPKMAIKAIEVCEDSETFFTGGRYGIIKEWSLKKSELVFEFPSSSSDGTIHCMLLLEEEGYLVTGSSAGVLRQYDLKKRAILLEHETGHNFNIIKLALNRTLCSFFCVAMNGIITQWSYTGMCQVANLQAVTEDLIYDLKISWDDRYLFAGGRLGRIKQLNLLEDEEYIDWDDLLSQEDMITALAVF
jgi:WD40 repeat protein